MMDFWDFMRRTETGKIVNEGEFDRKIGELAAEVVKKYEIRYTPDDPVPDDDGLADRLFEAAKELFINLGIFILDTRKVVYFTDEEVSEALSNAPEIVIYGTGNEQVTVPHREIEDSRDPVVARAGIGRKDASKMVKTLLNLYEKDIKNAPIGKSFRECYDIDTVKPKDEYLKLWSKTRARLKDMGLDFNLLYR
ncbi:MAG TPA: monomethylamine:corrinoid methyltransferase [Spirochaetes bacterium]|nr:monomethylamine:corrinoid methyltransferase [Spirochaetota bacterium]